MNANSSSTTDLLTYEDYCLIPDDGRRHEIINGGHCVSLAPSFQHQQIVLRLSFKLYEFVQVHGLGVIAFAPIDVFLSEHDVIQPDVLFISSERESIITKKNIQGAPDLLIEVLSESNRRQDEVVKRKLYGRYGVNEYWIVDPELETVKIYQLQDDSYGPATMLSLGRDEALTSQVMPDLSLKLSNIFKS